MERIFSAVFLFLLLLTPSLHAGNQPSAYVNRIPPKLLPADEASREQLRVAAARAAKFRNASFVYTLRKTSFQLHDDLSCTVTSSDTIYVRHPSFTINVLPSRQLDKARVILPDGRRFETSARALPKLSAGTLLTLHGSFRTSAPKILPFQQIIYDLQQSGPVARFEIDFSDRFRHKFYHAPAPLIQSRRENGGRITYAWDGAVPARIPCANEAFPRSSRMRLVLTTLPSWNELRQWVREMMRPEEKLDESGKKLLRKLVEGASDKTGQVRRIYEFLSKLRYLTVPVGEAKFRPQPISSMLRNGYGDCKDKSNALYVFCRELGIPAERVLVNSGGQVDPAFPSWQFNHMIVRIPELPGYPDGLWLDPADGQTPFGELSAGTLDTEGLVLSGPVLFRRVEVSDPEKIHSRIEENMKIDSAGNVVLRIQLNGFFASRFRMFLNRSGPRLRNETEALLDSLLPGAEMKFFQFQSATSSCEFRARLPLSGVLPQMTVSRELVNPFIPASIPRPVRLYDGHRVTYSRQVTVEGCIFRDFFWRIQRERYFAELKIKGNRIDYSFGLLRCSDNQIPPLVYKEIRSALSQLRLRLNSIRESVSEQR